MRRIRQMALLGVAVAAMACRSDYLTVPNYNSPTVDGVGKDPNGIQLVATGILASDRGQLNGNNTDLGQFGREVYNYFTTDGRTVSNYLVGIPGPQRLDPAGFASGLWSGRYQSMKNTIELIKAANASTQSAAAKSATEGFSKTFRALQLLYVIQTRDTLGAPYDIPDDPSVPAAWHTRDEVYAFISTLLEDGKTKLAAGGGTFPFAFHSGWAGFDSPAGFLRFNRGLAAKVLVIRGSLGCGATCYSQALTALGESFAPSAGSATTFAQIDVGPRHIYSTATGDAQNGGSFAVTNFVYAHSQAYNVAQLQAGGAKDDRVLRKMLLLAVPVNPPGLQNLAAEYRFTIYPNNSSPAPIMRAEELLLLRAEANWASNNLAAALVDLNTVRTVSGKLAPLTSVPSGAAGLDLIMYEKHLSNLFEGTRWVDMRRWGRLAQLPIDRAGMFVARVMPIPQGECDARGGKQKGCEGNL